MDTGLVLLILIGAFGASWYTAHAAGRFWTESKIIGGWIRFIVISSLVTSAIGFTGVYFMALLLLASLTSTLLSQINIQALYPISLGILGTPGVGAVPNLWLNGQVMGRRNQLIGSMAGPGINLPVHPADMLDASLRAPRFFEWFGGLFKSGDKGSGGSDNSDSGKLILILLVLALAVLAICGGVVTTILIVQTADREHVGEIFDLYPPPQASPS